MKILIVNNGLIPVTLYGGTERVIWYLGKELVKLGHQVSYLVQKGSYCDFGKVYFIDEKKEIIDQIPPDIDIIHFNFVPEKIEALKKPYLITMHGNSNDTKKLDINTVFVSENHAQRYGATAYIYNGLDWNDYIKPDWSAKRTYFHFLGNAAWRLKNVKGAIEIVKSIKNEHLKVLGGVRFNLKMGLRLTFSPRIHFYGMVGGAEKDQLLNHSKGLIFPVRWNEPFGLAIIESLYFGCPVLGTPYGSLPELVGRDVGFLSNKKEDLVEVAKNIGQYSNIRCHEYARDCFNSYKMAVSYISMYEKILSGIALNTVAPALKVIQTEKFLNFD